MDAAIQLRGLTLVKGKKCFLDAADFAFHEGMIHGIYAPEPGGGEVFLSALTGLVRPKAGKVFVDYQEVGVEIDFPEALGIMLGRDGLLHSFTALENLMNLARVQKSVTEKECMKLISSLGLRPLLRKKLRRYDGAMRRRVFFAQAVLENPLFLFLENPFSLQDEDGREKMKRIVEQLRQQGSTILVASPCREDLAGWTDTLAVLEDGHITLEEVEAVGTHHQCAEPDQNLQDQ